MKSISPQYHIIGGLICLLLSVVVLIVDITSDYLAGMRAQEILLQMQIDSAPATAGTEQPAAAPAGAAVLPTLAEQYPPASGLEPENAAPAAPKPKPSYSTIGVLSIAALKVKLPVISECTDAALKVSVCRYMGDAEEKPRRLVVAGHNYKSHFGRLPKLSAGDEICFIHPNGNQYYYAVTEIMEIAADDHLALREGEWDISLFTCTPDGKRRVLVRAVAVASEEEAPPEVAQPEETQPPLEELQQSDPGGNPPPPDDEIREAP